MTQVTRNFLKRVLIGRYKCNIQSCKKRIAPLVLKLGQSYIVTENGIEVYCSEAHWELNLKERLPHH